MSSGLITFFSIISVNKSCYILINVNIYTFCRINLAFHQLIMRNYCRQNAFVGHVWFLVFTVYRAEHRRLLWMMFSTLDSFVCDLITSTSLHCIMEAKTLAQFSPCCLSSLTLHYTLQTLQIWGYFVLVPGVKIKIFEYRKLVTA
jgi:hypothetical protein